MHIRRCTITMRQKDGGGDDGNSERNILIRKYPHSANRNLNELRLSISVYFFCSNHAHHSQAIASS